jgi:hypothetical protein
MKRSEMKSKLQQFLDSKLQYEHADDELVEQLLLIVEKSGLCPVTVNDKNELLSLDWEQENE